MSTDSQNSAADAEWVGGDWQEPPRGATGVAMCGACRVRGRCRLGIESEHLGDDGVVDYQLSCPADNEGGPLVAHGGWTAGVLDEVVGHVPLLSGQLAVTGSLSVRFVRPVPIERPLTARAWLTRREGSRWYIEAVLVLAATGAELARAEAILVARDGAHFERHRRWMAEQDQAGDGINS